MTDQCKAVNGQRLGRHLRRGTSGAAGQQAPHQQRGVVHVQRMHPLPRPARQPSKLRTLCL